MKTTNTNHELRLWISMWACLIQVNLTALMGNAWLSAFWLTLAVYSLIRHINLREQQ